MRTHLKGRELTLAAALSFAGAAHGADTFFVNCEAALETPPYRALADFYASHEDQPKPNSCFRLNSREFLVTVTGTGRVAQGLYYFDAAKGTYDYADGAYRPNVSVKREFDIGKKHFALLETSNLHAGRWDVTYEVLSLRPKSAGKPFSLQMLLDLQQDPEAGMCGTRLKEGRAAEVVSIDVSATCTMANMIAFRVKTQDCPAGEVRSVLRVFEWNGAQFDEFESP